MDRRQTAGWAVAAGSTGMAANVLLVAFYALELGRGPLGPVSLGSLNDLVGSVSTALMVPVALALGPWWVRLLGLVAMAVFTVAGPLLVFGVLSFEEQLPIALASIMALSAWMALTGRRLAGTLPRRVSRLAVLAGGGLLIGVPLVGLGLLLPWQSWPQLLLFGIGGVSGTLGWLAMPVWFVVLGRALRTTSDPVPASR